MNEMMDENSDESLRERHLDWTAKQGRILTANGRANEYFCQERGFPFEEDELPHYYLMRGDCECDTSFSHLISQPAICGAWSRAYFVGGWEYSSDQDETVYNVQTDTLFIDLRIPTTRKRLLPSTATSLSDYTVEQLKFYARQHVFCGFSVVSTEKERLVCVRHHCLDWNFVGTPRTRPNKWWIETNDDSNKWKEWAFATDDHGQHYYCEQWERLPGGEASEPVLALRKQRLHDNNDEDEDGMLLVVGTHFNYIKGHAVLASISCHKYPNATSLVTLVDAALEAGHLATALEWLGRIEAGHGHVDNWIVDCAIQPWKENTRLFQKEELVVTGGNDFDETCHVLWKGERWNIFETTFQNVQQLKDLFQ